MTPAAPGPRLPSDVPSAALIPFVLLTLAITWGIAGFYIFLPELAVPLFGALEGAHPLYFLAVWGPGIAGIVVVLAYGGRPGLRAFLLRLRMWRAGAKWWAFVLLFYPLIFMAGSLIKGGPLLAPAEDGFAPMLVLALIMLFLGPVEELGWRGVAQPLLQRHMAPVWAGALIGLFWGLWHLPAFYLSGTVYADWNFPVFLVGTTSMAILFAAMFNATGGSLLLPVLFHWQAILPFWPDGQPWDTWLTVAVMLVAVWIKRDAMFTRRDAVTEVIPRAG